MKTEAPKLGVAKVEATTPYGDDRHKSEQVREMFDSIAPAYDFMNRAMTLGIDKLWRAKAVRMIKKMAPLTILDVATGTGDLAIKMARSMPRATVTGLDLSAGMVERGNAKVAKARLSDRVKLEVGDSLAMPYADGAFDCVTVAYGVRNFERLEDGYREMLRVLRPGGVICVVELSEPAAQPARGLYKFYSGNIIPMMGRIVSHDARAYSYLPESIAACPQREAMTSLLEKAGFRDARWKSLTLGVVTIYTACK